MKKLLRILSWAFAVFWVGVALVSMLYVIAAGRSPTGPELFGYRFMTVLSDSMVPTIRSGDLVVGRPPKVESIEVGQTVTYRNHIAQRLITHRVKAVTKVGSELAFITQGDANDTPDSPVQARDVVAVFSFRVPYFGYIVAFAQHWTGLVILVVLPGAALMISEAVRLVRLLRLEQRQEQTP